MESSRLESKELLTGYEGVQKRQEDAQRLIHKDRKYCRLVDTPNTRLPDEPYDYQNRDDYYAEVQQYFGHRTDYYAKYDVKSLALWQFWKRSWRDMSSLFDETIEQRFPRDRSLRKYISAFQIATVSNQKSNIRVKRSIQAFGQMIAFIPAYYLLTFDDATQITTPFGTLGGNGLVGVITGIAALSIIALNVILRHDCERVREAYSSDARLISSKIQSRLNAIVNIYQMSLSKVHEEEYAQEGGANPEWPGRSKWWSQLSLWLPMRVEGIEKFLQLEMERLHIHIIRLDKIGNWTAYGLTLFILVPWWLQLYFLADIQDSLTVIALSISSLAAIVIAMVTKHSSNSIQMDDLRQFIGEHDWPSFSEMHIDEQIGELIRVDKENIRIEKLRGGGLGSPGIMPGIAS